MASPIDPISPSEDSDTSMQIDDSDAEPASSHRQHDLDAEGEAEDDHEQLDVKTEDVKPKFEPKDEDDDETDGRMSARASVGAATKAGHSNGSAGHHSAKRVVRILYFGCLCSVRSLMCVCVSLRFAPQIKDEDDSVRLVTILVGAALDAHIMLSVRG